MTDKTAPMKPHWFQILLALAEHDLHGLAIMKAVLQQTDEQIRLWPAMLYGSLKQMTEQGLIEELDPPEGPGAETDRRRFYGLSSAGGRALAAEVDRLAGYVRLAEERDVVGESVGT